MSHLERPPIAVPATLSKGPVTHWPTVTSEPNRQGEFTDPALVEALANLPIDSSLLLEEPFKTLNRYCI